MKSFINRFFPLESLRSKEAIALLMITTCMLGFEYFGWQGPFHRLMGETSWYRMLNLNVRNFYAQIWTTISFYLMMVITPVIVLKFLLKHNDWMISLPQKGSLKSYLILYALMFPVLYLVSLSPNFYRFYPLYRPVGINDWLLFELVYLPQFFAVEFFFRGPLLSFFEKYNPGRGVFFMVFPYALIHIHKPFPEAVGSIFAGIVLGHLALKGKSIWAGVALHMGIALSMDTLGLFQSGFFN